MAGSKKGNKQWRSLGKRRLISELLFSPKTCEGNVPVPTEKCKVAIGVSISRNMQKVITSHCCFGDDG